MKTPTYFLLLMFLPIILFAQQTAIAVNDLTGSGFNSDELRIISDRLRSELFQTGQYQVMERSEMNLIFQEVQFQMSGACDETACLVQAGQLLGVEQIAAGSVGKIDDFFTITVRIIDVQSGQIVASADHDYSGNIAGFISTGIHTVSNRLTGTNITITDPVHTESGYSSVEINTTPEGAVVTINQDDAGITPYIDSLLPGRYELILQLDGFEDISERISIVEGEPFSELFELEEEGDPRRGRVTRIVSGIAAAGTLGMGVYFNSQAEEANKDASNILQEAEDTGSSAGLTNDYNDALNSADQYTTMRNIFYGTAGASVVAFGVSFFF